MSEFLRRGPLESSWMSDEGDTRSVYGRVASVAGLSRRENSQETQVGGWFHPDVVTSGVRSVEDGVEVLALEAKQGRGRLEKLRRRLKVWKDLVMGERGVELESPLRIGDGGLVLKADWLGREKLENVAKVVLLALVGADGKGVVYEFGSGDGVVEAKLAGRVVEKDAIRIGERMFLDEKRLGVIDWRKRVLELKREAGRWRLAVKTGDQASLVLINFEVSEMLQSQK